jgi:hypothetical protein
MKTRKLQRQRDDNHARHYVVGSGYAATALVHLSCDWAVTGEDGSPRVTVCERHEGMKAQWPSKALLVTRKKVTCLACIALKHIPC